MREIKSATEALELTVESRIRALENGTDYSHESYIILSARGIETFYTCPLCAYTDQNCELCPIGKILGVDSPHTTSCRMDGLECGHDPHGGDDPEMAISFILTIQYYWDKRFGEKGGL